MSTARVVVVGGGITGLAAAFTLQDEAARAGQPLDLTVLEAGPCAGGHVQTTRVDGFLIEAGPNGFLSREPHTLALIEGLGLTARLVEARPEARRRYILRGGRLCRVPDGPATLVTSPALSWRAKLRLLGEPFAAAASDPDESVYAFAVRRLGRETADMLVDAAVAGISAGDPRRLSVAAQFPRLAEMERTHGSLLRAMFARTPKPPGAPPGPARLLSFDDGLGVLTGALARRLGRSLRLNAAARALDRTGDGWQVSLGNGDAVTADHIVLAVPARRAAPMVEPLDDALAGALAAFEYTGLTVVVLGYRAADVPRPLDGYGYLATSPERLATLGVVFESSMFAGRAPQGTVLLRVMLGGSRRPELVDGSEDEALRLAQRELAPVLGVVAPPLVTAVYRWPAAIAQYTIGHRGRRECVERSVARHAGLAICGTSYDGVSLNDAVKSGRLAATGVAARLWGESRAAAVVAPVLAGVQG
jgi:protoporphyrinogen/coproporphyrinogen III oxidase